MNFGMQYHMEQPKLNNKLCRKGGQEIGEGKYWNGGSLLILADESLVEIHHLCLDTGTNHLQNINHHLKRKITCADLLFRNNVIFLGSTQIIILDNGSFLIFST